MSILFVLIGIPGSGKSSWIKHHTKNFYIVCPDNIRKKYYSDISDQNNNTAVWNIAKGQVISALECNHDVVLDATNVNTLYRREFLKDIIPYHKVKAVVFNISPEKACSRIAEDIKNGIDRSNVPEQTVYRMYGEYLHTLKVLNQEGFESITYEKV